MIVCMLAMSGVLPGADVEIIGHRGASYDAPENTLASVNLSWQQSADATEIDVALSKDGHIVVFHDKTTKKLAGKDIPVAEQTLEELRSLDVGRWKNEKWAGEKIPTLAEVLKTIPDGKRLFIEVKCGPEAVPELRRVCRASGKTPTQMPVISFSLDVVTAVKKAMPDHQVFLIAAQEKNQDTGRWEPPIDELIAKAKAAGLDGLDLKAVPAVNAEAMAKVRKAGFKLYVWTVNDPQEAERLRAVGIDGITTDRPGWLREQLR